MGRRVFQFMFEGGGSDINLVSSIVTIVGPLVNQGTNFFFHTNKESKGAIKRF